MLLVVPRAGTISPWSSKATDIAHVCGLTAIRRIERGIEYRLLDTRPLGPERLAAIAPVLFDRMTEMVLFDPEHAQRLFGHTAPKPLVQIDREHLESANRELGLALSADEISYLVSNFQRLGPPADRCRADDVCSGQLRALPPQDLQCQTGSSMAASATSRCSR